MEYDIGGLSVYYETCGEGRPFLMIHGFAPDHRMMSGCMEPILCDMPGFQRIYIDLPGIGQTKGAKWIHNSDDMLLLVETFIENVFPLDCAGHNLQIEQEGLFNALVREWIARVG